MIYLVYAENVAWTDLFWCDTKEVVGVRTEHGFKFNDWNNILNALERTELDVRDGLRNEGWLEEEHEDGSKIHYTIRSPSVLLENIT